MPIADKLRKQEKVAFLTCIIVGVMSQGMGLFNKFSVHDDANSLFGLGSTYNVGRWALDFIGRFEKDFFGDANYSLPLYNGLLSLMFIALTACIIVRALDISSNYISAFIGAVMACFPTVTTAFGFIYGAHIIMFGLLVGILGAYLMCEGEKLTWILGGILLAAISVGIYQAFIPMILSFILFHCIHRVILADHTTEKETIISILLKPVYIIGFMAVYFIINKIYLRILGAEMSNYKGVNDVGNISISEYFIRVCVAYKQFILPSKDTDFYMYPSNVRVLYYIFAMIGVCFVGYCIYRKTKQSMILTVALAGLFALVPLATNFIIVMTGVNVLHSYMMYASVMPFVLVAYLFDKNIHVKDSVHANRIFITLCCILLVMYIRYDNKCYFLANYAQQEAISYYNTLITRIKSAEGYDDEYPVAFVNVGNIHDASLGGVEKVRRGVFDDINLIPYWSVDESINNYAWLDFMQNWCGYKPNVVDAAEIGNASEIESMPNYPKDGSIKVINGVVVVKF
ncbi:hypothetical protein bpr_I0446 [Butyrivibrio proteoclasticus B316]|uniref:TonB C-terminal domain-containing protein n=1 Tax=Butyrivibrio proteoclasticus (strain ATCC 51982 / DSM 14932 / B316) TaxID=515622 RepID=E0RZZ3_BUTPB|nr:glucosyltransferase domain-containing protein [Butyrivibrio proteoclasticus]ADL33194.1 hypothetical protein bpr_I0446 [Butyrivibrio proteoclasticus B316]